MSNHKTIVVKQTPLAHRLIGSLFIFSMLLLCIYVSQGSAWWTFFTGTFFVVFLTIFLLSCVKKGTVTINTKAEALEWARSFPEDHSPEGNLHAVAEAK